MIQNPILPGFFADPSLLRVGEDYYIATSTFVWHPGVAISHSRDLKHWRLLTHPLNSLAALDMIGEGNSCGIWAPHLNFDPSAGLYYLLFTDVKSTAARFFDLHNYIITAPDITGPWSEPVRLNSSGFDPSILFDDDGRAYVANLEWDFRKGYEHPGAIVLQEYSKKERCLMGEPRRISRGGSDLGCLEGPLLVKRNGWYYLITAEGGTGFGHAVIVSRSRSVWGPYEPDPANPILTSIKAPFPGRNDRDFLKPHLFNPAVQIQKAGHASICDTPQGEWFLAHLGARPLMPSRASVLGRETFLQRCHWTDDGWLRVEDPDGRPRESVAEPAGVAEHPFPSLPETDEFTGPGLPPHYYTLRRPLDAGWANFTDRPGWLSMVGRESLHSYFNVSLVGRRIQHFCWEGITCMEFAPEKFQQMAGLVLLNGQDTWFYLRLYYSETFRSPCLGIMLSDRGELDELLDSRVPVSQLQVYLQAGVRNTDLQFYYSLDGGGWQPIGPVLDMTRLSDEYNRSFAGTFVALTCQDLSGAGKKAYFKSFTYRVTG